MDKFLEILALIIVLLILTILLAFPTKWLWNYLMPDLFGLPIIGFDKALGMNILSMILFGHRRVSK